LRIAFGAALALGLLLTASAFAETPATWNGLPDRFQIDTGYFRLDANTVLRFNGPAGGAGDVDFENDLGLDRSVNTFWTDATWRIGRRHQLKLGFTRLHRERGDHTLQRDFTWGGETYNAGLSATSTSGSKLLGGYYRFALVRNDRFEIGPAIGVGYLWLDAGIQATGTVDTPAGPQSRTLDKSASIGSVTGALGGYATAWPAKRLALHADYLYIKVSPGDSEASVTDWRLAADFYFSTHVGLGAQYKYNRYSYDRGILASKLGGEITFEGFQVYLSFLF
jgi:hypothetical protein